MPAGTSLSYVAAKTLIQRAGFWLIHINRVALLVLVASAALLVVLRLLLVAALRPRLEAQVQGFPSRHRLAGLVSAAALVGLLAGHRAIRPDEVFNTAVAGAALAEGQHARAITFYEPLVEWGIATPEVRLDLARCYFALGRCGAALQVLGPALERTDSVEGRLLRAGARECAGDGAGALSDLQRALDLSQSEPQRAAIRGYLSEARLRHPGDAAP